MQVLKNTEFIGNNWTRTVEQISADMHNQIPQSKVIERNKNLFRLDAGNKYIDLFLNLSDIGSPDFYNVVSRVESQFMEQNVTKCTVEDITNWVQLPPPKIFISTIVTIDNVASQLMLKKNGFDVISKWGYYSSHYKLKHVTGTNAYTKIAGPTDMYDI